MAKINAHGAHQVGPTLFAERARTFDLGSSHTETRTYYEAWRLRSDGAVLRRAVSSRPVEGSDGLPATLHRGSAYTIVGSVHGPNINIDWLRGYLKSRGYTIVKER